MLIKVKMNSKKIEKIIQKLEKDSEEIEILAINLIRSAPIKYLPKMKAYGFDSLPKDLIKLQQQIITKYNTWYNSVYPLIDRYLSHQLDEFKKKYKRQIGGWFSYDITGILELKVDIDGEDKSSVVNKFLECFTYQKSQLLSLKNIVIDEISERLSSLNQLEESLVQNIYDYLLKNPTVSNTKSRSITVQKRKAVKKRDNYTCQICEEKFPEGELEIDHIFPHSLGGSNRTTNLMVLCRSCNENKNNRLEYYKSDEGKQKILLNIREFVGNLLLISNFGEWLKKAGDERRKRVLLRAEGKKEIEDIEEKDQDIEEEEFEEDYFPEEEPKRPNIKVIETYLGFLDDSEMSSEDLHDRFRMINLEAIKYSYLKDLSKEEKEVGDRIIKSICKNLSRHTERNLIQLFSEILYRLATNDIFIETLTSHCLDTIIQLYKEKKYYGYVIELLDICGVFTNVERKISQAINDRNYELLEKFRAIRLNAYKNEGIELVKFLNSKLRELSKPEDQRLKELTKNIINMIEGTFF